MIGRGAEEPLEAVLLLPGARSGPGKVQGHPGSGQDESLALFLADEAIGTGLRDPGQEAGRGIGIQEEDGRAARVTDHAARGDSFAVLAAIEIDEHKVEAQGSRLAGKAGQGRGGLPFRSADHLEARSRKPGGFGKHLADLARGKEDAGFLGNHAFSVDGNP